jgi:hypothetical protein
MAPIKNHNIFVILRDEWPGKCVFILDYTYIAGLVLGYLVVSWLTDLILILRSTRDVWAVHVYTNIDGVTFLITARRTSKFTHYLLLVFLSCRAATDTDNLWTLNGFDIRAVLVAFVLDKVTKCHPNMNILLHSVFIIPPKLYVCNHSNSTDVVAYCKKITAALKLPLFVSVLLTVIPQFLTPFNRRVVPIL